MSADKEIGEFRKEDVEKVFNKCSECGLNPLQVLHDADKHKERMDAFIREALNVDLI